MDDHALLLDRLGEACDQQQLEVGWPDVLPFQPPRGLLPAPELLAEVFPFSTLKGGANVLIFPDLQSANVAFKLVGHLGGAEAIGPILMGMRRPVHLLQHGSEVKDIVYMTAIAVVDAQEAEREVKGPSSEVTVPVLR